MMSLQNVSNKPEIVSLTSSFSFCAVMTGRFGCGTQSRLHPGPCMAMRHGHEVLDNLATSSSISGYNCNYYMCRFVTSGCLLSLLASIQFPPRLAGTGTISCQNHPNRSTKASEPPKRIPPTWPHSPFLSASPLHFFGNSEWPGTCSWYISNCSCGDLHLAIS